MEPEPCSGGIERILEVLDDSQRRAVCGDPSKPLLIIAGAGSGKTLTMASRIVFLILNGVNPWNILGLCFSRQAAEVLRARVAALLPHDSAKLAMQLKLKTFHAFGLECLRRYGYIDLSTEVYDARRQREFAASVVEAHALHYKGVEAVVTLIDFVNKAKTKKNMRAGAELDPSRQAAYLFRFYQSMLHNDNNAVDFGDLEQMFLNSLRPVKQRDTAGVENGDTNSTSNTQDISVTLAPSQLAILLRSQYTHFVVDEFQDLNEVQLECLALLAGDECRVTCVGDPNQCIYAWRGAMAQNFDRWRSRFPHSTVMRLGTNYRSCWEIVSVINQMTDSSQSSHKGESGGALALLRCKYTWDQFKAISHVIEERLRGRDHALTYGDIAVLCRTHRTARSLIRALEKDNIPVCELRHSTPKSFALVRALLSYLRLCIYPHSNIDIECVLREAPNHFTAAGSTKFLYALRAEGLRRQKEAGARGQLENQAHCSYFTVLVELVHNGFVHPQEYLRTTKPQQKLLRVIVEVTTAAHEALSRAYCNVEDVVRNVIERAGFNEKDAAGAKIQRRQTHATPNVSLATNDKMKRPRSSPQKPQVSLQLTETVDIWENVMEDEEEVATSSIPELLYEACRTVQEQINVEKSYMRSGCCKKEEVEVEVQGPCGEAQLGSPIVPEKDDFFTVLQRVIDEFLQLLPSDDFGPLKGLSSRVPNVATVTVTTVHQAKGKEWPAVIIPCCYEGEFPIDVRSAEEKRVFYVAMSRAMKHLFFITAERGTPQSSASRRCDGGLGVASHDDTEPLQVTPYLRAIVDRVEMIDFPGSVMKA
ncbi:unnamed protein product [Trypanosoma congolense IL3000]|uniref:DNA 3'-5' helicase n=1 Tax=Trypanosoma congolense (strain IL3000) TaxID=1068625 RepID=F9WDB4_TRYCI|nr:unnamed protein product [Trypanosoma congolense IL3000]